MMPTRDVPPFPVVTLPTFKLFTLSTTSAGIPAQTTASSAVEISPISTVKTAALLVVCSMRSSNVSKLLLIWIRRSSSPVYSTSSLSSRVRVYDLSSCRFESSEAAFRRWFWISRTRTSAPSRRSIAVRLCATSSLRINSSTFQIP